MKPTIEILERMKENSEKNKEEVFTRLYRYLLRPDLYFIAYQKLYSNNGAATEGVDRDTADGFSEAKVEKLIASLADESYCPKPSRRIYLKKPNGKRRPLGIPSFSDKLVQEVLRMVLEAVYEPIFLDRFDHYRHYLLCLHEHYRYTICNTGQRHHQCDQYYSVLWPLARSDSERLADFNGQSVAMPVFCHSNFSHSAV